MRDSSPGSYVTCTFLAAHGWPCYHEPCQDMGHIMEAVETCLIALSLQVEAERGGGEESSMLQSYSGPLTEACRLEA